MPLPLAIPLITGALGLGASIWGAHKGAQGHRRAADQMQGMYNDAAAQRRRAQGQADASRNQYMQALQGFDPRRYMNEALRGDVGVINRAHQGAFTNLQASNNSRGLLRSPIGQDHLMKDYNQRLADAMSQRSFQAAGLDQQRVGMYGNLYQGDQGQANEYMNAMYGFGNARAAAAAGQGDAWAQALGGAGGALMGFGGESLGYTQHGMTPEQRKKWRAGR